MDDLLTVADADRLLGTRGNKRLLKALIAQHRIPVKRVGYAEIMDAEGFRRLKAALEEWRRRPRLKDALSKSASA